MKIIKQKEDVTQVQRSDWPPRPRSLSEKGYRKFMARTTVESVNGMDFTLQSVSPTWYYEQNDKYGMTGGKKRSVEYMDTMFKNVVIKPAEVAEKGMGYFDETEDLDTAEKLISRIESFLRERKESRKSTTKGASE